MSDLNRIEQNNAELRECIEIAESLPDAPQSVGGYDIATMQKLLDDRKGLRYLYYYSSSLANANGELDWLSSVDTSKYTSCAYMFASANAIESVPLFDTSNVENATYMFNACYKLTNIPTYNFSKVTNFQQAFTASGLNNEITIDMASATHAYYMFYNCNKLKKCNLLNVNKLSDVREMFTHCSALEAVSPLVVVSGASIYNMFYNCSSLLAVSITLPESTSNIGSCFYGCSAIETISALDLRNCTQTSNAFYRCSALKNLTLKNIKYNIQVGSGSSYGHLLTVDSLVGLCYELRDTGSVKTLTIGSANLAKLASVYVRQIAITDAMRAEDDLIDEKLPFERCESTDEGATLIGDYILAKNWKLA